jgi:hypothetical protein
MKHVFIIISIITLTAFSPQNHKVTPTGAKTAHITGKLNLHGVTQGIPAKGFSMVISDKVEVIIEAEFTKPVTAAKLAQNPKK